MAATPFRNVLRCMGPFFIVLMHISQIWLQDYFFFASQAKGMHGLGFTFKCDFTNILHRNKSGKFPAPSEGQPKELFDSESAHHPSLVMTGDVARKLELRIGRKPPDHLGGFAGV